MSWEAAPGPGATPRADTEQGDSSPLRDPGEFREALTAALYQLDGAASVTPRLGSGELTEAARDVLALMQLAERAAVTLAADAVRRGVVTESTAAGLPQWLTRLAAGEPVDRLLPAGASTRSGPLVPVSVDHTGDETPGSGSDEGADPRPQVPGLEPAQVRRIARVATATNEAKNAPIGAALIAGEASVSCADAALKHAEKVLPLLPSATRSDVLGYYLGLPGEAGVRAVRGLTRRIIATYATEESLDDADAKLEPVESVTWADLDNGMTRLVAELTAEHATQLKAAISTLSAPAPCNECCADPHHRHTGERTGEPDPRAATKRRADALMLLALHGAAALEHDAEVLTRAPVRLSVTIDLEVLRGVVAGYGLTDDHESLTPGQVRRLACDADLVPIVLGSDSAPLDVGRVSRLATPAIRRAVAHRDRRCSFPGCERPPSWCQVHHIVPWWCGGSTSLDNSALLCQRHHTVVHRDQLSAEIVDGQVVWDLTPGRMATSAARVA